MTSSYTDSTSSSILGGLLSDINTLLKLSYPGSDRVEIRKSIAEHYILNELANLSHHTVNISAGNTLEKLCTMLSAEKSDLLVIRCRYYACTELVYFLVSRQTSKDTLLREEGVSYVLDHLYANDFKRIKSFDHRKSATFTTYASKIINNLLIDFYRRKGVESRIFKDPSGSSEGSDGSYSTEQELESTRPSQAISAENEINSTLIKSLADTILQPTDRTQKHEVSTCSRRQILQQTLNLSARERLFLRALCYDDLNINQIRVLPGFIMTVNEAYQFYQHIIEKVTDALKKSDMFDDIQDLLVDTVEHLEIIFDGVPVKIRITDVLYFKKCKDETVTCHARPRGVLQEGHVKQRFKRLKKNFFRHFTPISTDIIVANRHIEKILCTKGAYNMKLKGLPQLFEISKRHIKKLPYTKSIEQC
ncbi:MAG: DNA-directed RNA polymerase specialized sigma24 family protein [Flavobacteriales bacterium]|jgi:DNA-directed RNA polymerase specialized sigma24 family protein